MEYVSMGRTSGIEVSTGNITPIMKNVVVKVITENSKSVFVKHKHLEVEIPIKRFREEFVKV